MNYLLKFNGETSRWESDDGALYIHYDGSVPEFVFSDGRRGRFDGATNSWLVGGVTLRFDGTGNRARYRSNDWSTIIEFNGTIPAWEVTESGAPLFSVVANVAGQGQIAGVGYYAEGATVVVTAIPSAGWELTSWTIGAVQGSISPFTFTMPNSQVVITAVFTKIKYSVTINILDSTIQAAIDDTEENTITIDGVSDAFDGRSYDTQLSDGAHTVSIKMNNKNIVSGIFTI